MLIEILCVLIVPLLCLYLNLRYRRFGRLIAKIPGPRLWPIVGNMFYLAKDPEALWNYMRKCYSTYGGSIFRLYGFHMACVTIYQPEDVETILSRSRCVVKGLPYPFMEPWLGKGLLTSEGLKWHNSRKMLTPAFHFNILRRFTSTFTEHVQELITLVEKEVGQPMTDVGPLISQATLNIMCETAMGFKKRENLSSETDNYFKGLTLIGNLLANRTAKVWLYVDFTFILTESYRIQKKALQQLHTFTKSIIQKRRVALRTSEQANDFYTKKKPVMLDLLLELEKEGKIDEEEIREQVDTFLFEGHDTTAASLSFMIMRIANEPEVQEMIYKEMVNIFGESDRLPTIEELGEMKYLERCIKESLRLYPAVPFMARLVTEDIVLNGYTVPAGTHINFQIFDIHRNETVFPEPDRFDPDRFLPDRVLARHPYAYIPFSAGPRNCIGQKFAMLEMKAVMSGLIRRFHLEPVTRPQDIVFKCDIVLKSTDPIYVKFTNRM